MVEGFTKSYGVHMLVWYEAHETMESAIIELRKSNGTLINLLLPPHPPLSPESGGEDKGEGV
ncbi:MAG: hypothetical protein QME78_17425 [Thermodesulfobacteriota bacterium]|nr:hypothetical protein [Thermodesulfobacteriota bacterium]